MQKVKTLEELLEIKNSPFKVEAQSDVYWALVDCHERFEEVSRESDCVSCQCTDYSYQDVIVKRLNDGTLFQFEKSDEDCDDLVINIVYPHAVLKIEYQTSPQKLKAPQSHYDDVYQNLMVNGTYNPNGIDTDDYFYSHGFMDGISETLKMYGL